MKKILSLVLAMLMILSTVPLSTLAEEWKTEGTESLEETVEIPEENEAMSEEDEFVPETEPETPGKDEITSETEPETPEEDGIVYVEEKEDLLFADPQIVAEGFCGGDKTTEYDEDSKAYKNLEWTLDSNGVLTISGKGEMMDYGYYLVKEDSDEYIEILSPWNDYSDELIKLVLDKNILTIGDYAFYNCGSFTGELIIPESVTSIGNGAFYNCSGFTGNLVIPEGVTSIGEWAFCDCKSFTGKLIIPKSLIDIGNYAFVNCNFTGELIIPEGVISIGDSAFCGNFIGNIIIPKSVTTIGTEAFLCLFNIENILVEKNNRCYSSKDGILYNKDQTVLIACPAGKTGTINISKHVTTIMSRAFYDCYFLTGDLKIPEDVTNIGSYAFVRCSGFTAFYFKGDVPYIDEEAFIGCNATAYYPADNQTWTLDKLKNYGGNITWKPYIEGNTNFQINRRKLDAYSIIVKENINDSNDREMKYILSMGACISVTEDKCYISNPEGNVVIPERVESLTVSKAGFVSRTYTEAQLRKSTNLYLQKVDAECPVISGVWMDDVDILNEEYGMDLLDSDIYIVTPEIDWGESEPGNVKLMQGSQSVNIAGSSLSIKWSDYFDVSGSADEIYIVATNKKGKTAKHPLKVKLSTPESLEGFKFDLSDGLSFTLPESAGLFSGVTMKYGFDNPHLKVAIEGGKFTVAIGILDVKNTTEDIKSFVDEIKNLSIFYSDDKEGTQSPTEVELALKDLGIEKGKGINGDVTIVGFIEGYFDSMGKMVVVDQGLMLCAEGAYEYSLPFYAGPMPMFFEAKLMGELESAVNLYIDEKAKVLVPIVDIDFDIALSGRVGLGAKDFLSVSGGLEGKLENKFQKNFDNSIYYRMNATLGFYINAEALFYEFKVKQNLANAVWIELPEKKASLQMPTLLSAKEAYDASNYKPADISYLAKTQKRLLGAAKNLETSELVQNAYRSAKPQMVSFSDGTKLAVWIGYNGANTGYDTLNLYASYFDGTSWSKAAVIEDDGTYDAEPCLKLIDGTAYVVWMDASTVLPEDITLDSLTTLMDISMAKFDKEENSFTTVSVSSDDTLDMLPTVCGKGDTVYAVWEKNEANVWFSQTNDNTICARAWTEEGLGNMETPYSGLSMIGSLAASYDGEDLHIAYSTDTDGDLSTMEDMEVFIDGALAGENGVIDSGVTETNGVFWWYQGGNLVSSEGEKIENFAYDRYQVVDENGVRAVGYVVGDGLSSTLMARYYDSINRTWSEPVALTDGNKFVSSFCLSGFGGELEVITNEYDVIGDFESEDPYGTANIRLYTVENKVELQIEDVYYDAANYIAGSDMTFDVAIKNSGTKTAEMINIVLKGKNGTILSDYMYNASILPGVTKTVTCGFTVENVDPAEEVTVTVEDSISETVSLAYEDVALENISYGESANGKTLVYADIVNYGNTGSGELSIKLRRDAADGDCLAETVVENIAPLSVEHVSFELESTERDVYFISVENGEKEEKNLANNMDFVVLFSETELPTVLGDVNADGSINVLDANIVRRAAAKLIMLTDSQNLAADVNGDGNVDVIDANLIRRYAAKLITDFYA